VTNVIAGARGSEGDLEAENVTNVIACVKHRMQTTSLSYPEVVSPPRAGKHDCHGQRQAVIASQRIALGDEVVHALIARMHAAGGPDVIQWVDLRDYAEGMLRDGGYPASGRYKRASDLVWRARSALRDARRNHARDERAGADEEQITRAGLRP
jgi:hypothetical protein